MAVDVSRLLALIPIVALCACESKLDSERFQRKAESVYMDANPGFGIMRRKGTRSTFVRGDQVDVLDIAPLFLEYDASGKSASAFLEEWRQRLLAEIASRRRTLDTAGDTLIPIIKSGTWIKVQDLGAIGPKRLQNQIRPWRQKVAEDVYLLLGIPEELLGFRYVSIEEVEATKKDASLWLKAAVANLVKHVGTSTGAELRSNGRLMVVNLVEIDGVSGLILDRHFRRRMLEKFDAVELGAAVPNRDVLILFDNTDFVTVKPIRARTHQLYDVRNHPGFRGLLRFDADTVSVAESATPNKKK